ncbi:MAG: hypothetical protein K1X50_10445 [Candidatus Promineofilum sp.]|nr:hypothetical protein [Promineifilum sp.]
MSTLPSDPKPQRSNRRTLLILGAIITIFACTACGIIYFLIPNSDDNNRPTAEVAEQTEVEVTRLVEIEVTRLVEVEVTRLIETIITPTPPPAPTAAPTPEIDPTAYIAAVNITPNDLPTGEPGLVVIAAGPPNQFGAIPVVVRNNTDTPVYNLDISATARDTAGRVLGTGSSLDLLPSYVPPAGVAFGRVLFQDTPLDGATIEYLVTGSDDPGTIFIRRDLEVIEHNLVSGNVVGSLLNSNAAALDLINVAVICFDDTLVPTVSRDNYTDQERVESGAQLPFSVDLLGDEAQCDRYLLAARGTETD